MWKERKHKNNMEDTKTLFRVLYTLYIYIYTRGSTQKVGEFVHKKFLPNP
jgi:hypothetical protein